MGTGTETGTVREGQGGRTGIETVTAKVEVRRGCGGQRGPGQKCVRWWRMYWCTGIPTRGKVLIRLGTYNIRNSRNRGLDSSLRGVSQANMDLGIF